MRLHIKFSCLNSVSVSKSLFLRLGVYFVIVYSTNLERFSKFDELSFAFIYVKVHKKFNVFHNYCKNEETFSR